MLELVAVDRPGQQQPGRYQVMTEAHLLACLKPSVDSLLD
jgi:hypothetical protein